MTTAELLEAGVVGEIPDREVDPGEAAEATQWLIGYRGSWGPMLDMQDQHRRYGMKFRWSVGRVNLVLSNKQREQEWAAEKAAQPAVPATEGWYRRGDEVFQVVRSEIGNLYAKKLVPPTKPGKTGWSFEYAPKVAQQLSGDDRLTLAEAKRLGSLFGICVVCGSELSNPTSVAEGIGPVCSGRLSA